MRNIRVFLWFIASSIFALLSNIVAAGLEHKYQLINNQGRWLLVLVVFVVIFLSLLWLEYRKEIEKTKNAGINKLKTGFFAKTGKITIRTNGQLPRETDANIVDIGSGAQTKDIDITYNNQDESK